MTKTQRSYTMSRIRSAGTSFERGIFRKLRKRGIHFRTHAKGVIGKPDIALPNKKKAVFLHSDFWHGWQLPRWEKVLPNYFWINKIRKNRNRDKTVLNTLRRNGWKVFVLWEHTYNTSPKEAITSIAKFLK